MPRKKLGSETPTSARPVLARSRLLLRLIAATTPAGRPITSDSASASTLSSIVTGSRETIASVTG